MRVTLPVFQFVATITGRRLIKEGILKCKGGEKVMVSKKYLCHIDFKKKKIVPLTVQKSTPKKQKNE